MFEKKKKDEKKIENKEEKFEPTKFENIKRYAKSAFYFNGRHYRIGDVVDLKKEDLDFLDKRGKLK